MLPKLWAIAWKELYITFTDRNLILIMIAAPLAISSIVGLAFGGLGGGDVPIEDIPIAIINHDEGSSFGPNFGQIFITALVPDALDTDANTSTAAPICEDAENLESGESTASTITLFDLTEAVAFDAALARTLADDGVVAALELDPGAEGYLEEVARAAVDNGEYTALIIIPSDFTQKVSYIPVVHPQIEETGVTVYANSGRPVAAGIVASIVEGLTSQIATGNITVAATFSQLQENFGLATVGQAATSLDMASAFACAFTPASNTVSIDLQTVEGSATGNASTAILVTVGASQAMFFALFTAQFGVFSMYDERRNWTLQRLIMSPTPRLVILAGKLIGVFVTVVFQLLVLLIALSLVGSLLQGGLTLIWGTDLIRVALVLIAAALAVSGFGMLLAGIARTPEQGQTIGPVFNIGFAILGGAFGFALPQAISGFSMVYWGSDAFNRLAAGQGDIGVHLLVLAVQGLIMFAIGVVLFNRRFDV